MAWLWQMKTRQQVYVVYYFTTSIYKCGMYSCMKDKGLQWKNSYFENKLRADMENIRMPLRWEENKRNIRVTNI